MIGTRANRLAYLTTTVLACSMFSAPAMAGDPDFCARLAANADIKAPPPVDGRTSWTASALNFGQKFLFGGTAATGVAAQPSEPATVEDYKRLTKACEGDSKGATCKLAGPLEFQRTWKTKTTTTSMAAGERATVIVRGLKSSCQTEAP